MALAIAVVLFIKTAIGSMCAAPGTVAFQSDADNLLSQIVLCTAHGTVTTVPSNDGAPPAPDEPRQLGHCDACGIVAAHAVATADGHAIEVLTPAAQVALAPQVTDSPALLLRSGGAQSRAPPAIATL